MAATKQIQTELMQRFGGTVSQPALPQTVVSVPTTDSNVIIWQMGTVWGTVTSQVPLLTAKNSIQ